MKNLLSKIKSQIGATGTDILVSASIVVLSIGVVSVMYVNTSIQSKNITRTAGATRIATNIMENIEAMSYDEFVTAYGGGATLEKVGGASVKVFSTNIPTGFKAIIKADKVYGSQTDNNNKFDLVRKVEVKVEYPVGKVTENVTFNAVKQREIISECNEPALGDLRTQLAAGLKYYPVKYVPSAHAYVKTTESDPEWYNYSTKQWATVIISKVAESSLFDVNGKFIGTYTGDSVATSNASYTRRAVWVPKYLTSSASNTTFKAFAYRNTVDKKILEAELSSLGTSKFKYYKSTAKASNEYNNASVWGTATGIWSLVKADNSFTSTAATGLNANTTYGPCIMP